MMFNLMLFKDRLRVSREALGINQEEFAKKWESLVQVQVTTKTKLIDPCQI